MDQQFLQPSPKFSKPVSLLFLLLVRHMNLHFSSVLLLSRVRLFATPWTAAHQASLSITNSQSLLKLMSIKSVMPSNHLILCQPLSSHLQSFPASGAFLVSQLFTSGGQSIGASVSCMLSSQLGRNMFCIMFEWEPSVWEEIELYLQWTATLENRAVLCNWTCLSLVLI